MPLRVPYGPRWKTSVPTYFTSIEAKVISWWWMNCTPIRRMICLKRNFIWRDGWLVSPRSWVMSGCLSSNTTLHKRVKQLIETCLVMDTRTKDEYICHLLLIRLSVMPLPLLNIICRFDKKRGSNLPTKKENLTHSGYLESFKHFKVG